MSTPIGSFLDTSDPAVISDMERRTGVYVLGRSGKGKSSLVVRMMERDVTNGHGGVFS